MKKKEIEVTRESVSAIRCGKDVYEVARTSDNKGVIVRNAQGSVFVPSGSIGKAIAAELLTLVNVPDVKKRTRRTKAEIEANKGETTSV